MMMNTGCRFDEIVLVDDNYIDNMINKKFLSRLEMSDEITMFTKPQEVMDWAKSVQYHPESKGRKLLLLDLNMPEMSGFDLLKNFQSEHPEVLEEYKVIILSSSGAASDVQKASRNKAVVSFIQKPLSKEIVQQVINPLALDYS